MTINIIVACGSGIATSTIAAGKVEELLKEMEITNYNIRKSSMQEVQALSNSADLVLTTNMYNGELAAPHKSIIGFLTGIKEEKLKEELSILITEIIKEKENK